MMTAEKTAIQRICRLLADEPYFMEVTPDEVEPIVYRFAEAKGFDGDKFLRFETCLAIESIDPRDYLPGGRNE